MAGCLAPEKARINRVSQRPTKGARRGIGKIVLPTHGDDTWGEDAPQHAHHQHFSREKKRPPEFGGLSLGEIQPRPRLRTRLIINPRIALGVFDRRQEHAQGASFRVSAVILRGRRSCQQIWTPRPPPWLFLVRDLRKRLSVVVAHNEACEIVITRAIAPLLRAPSPQKRTPSAPALEVLVASLD